MTTDEDDDLETSEKSNLKKSSSKKQGDRVLSRFLAANRPVSSSSISLTTGSSFHSVRVLDQNSDHHCFSRQGSSGVRFDQKEVKSPRRTRESSAPRDTNGLSSKTKAAASSEAFHRSSTRGKRKRKRSSDSSFDRRQGSSQDGYSSPAGLSNLLRRLSSTRVNKLLLGSVEVNQSSEIRESIDPPMRSSSNRLKSLSMASLYHLTYTLPRELAEDELINYHIKFSQSFFSQHDPLLKSAQLKHSQEGEYSNESRMNYPTPILHLNTIPNHPDHHQDHLDRQALHAADIMSPYQRSNRSSHNFSPAESSRGVTPSGLSVFSEEGGCEKSTDSRDESVKHQNRTGRGNNLFYQTPPTNLRKPSFPATRTPMQNRAQTLDSTYVLPEPRRVGNWPSSNPRQNNGSGLNRCIKSTALRQSDSSDLGASHLIPLVSQSAWNRGSSTVDNNNTRYPLRRTGEPRKGNTGFLRPVTAEEAEGAWKMLTSVFSKEFYSQDVRRPLARADRGFLSAANIEYTGADPWMFESKKQRFVTMGGETTHNQLPSSLAFILETDPAREDGSNQQSKETSGSLPKISARSRESMIALDEDEDRSSDSSYQSNATSLVTSVTYRSMSQAHAMSDKLKSMTTGEFFWGDLTQLDEGKVSLAIQSDRRETDDEPPASSDFEPFTTTSTTRRSMKKFSSQSQSRDKFGSAASASISAAAEPRIIETEIESQAPLRRKKTIQLPLETSCRIESRREPPHGLQFDRMGREVLGKNSLLSAAGNQNPEWINFMADGQYLVFQNRTFQRRSPPRKNLSALTSPTGTTPSIRDSSSTSRNTNLSRFLICPGNQSAMIGFDEELIVDKNDRRNNNKPKTSSANSSQNSCSTSSAVINDKMPGSKICGSPFCCCFSSCSRNPAVVKYKNAPIPEATPIKVVSALSELFPSYHDWSESRSGAYCSETTANTGPAGRCPEASSDSRSIAWDLSGHEAETASEYEFSPRLSEESLSLRSSGEQEDDDETNYLNVTFKNLPESNLDHTISRRNKRAERHDRVRTLMEDFPISKNSIQSRQSEEGDNDDWTSQFTATTVNTVNSRRASSRKRKRRKNQKRRVPKVPNGLSSVPDHVGADKSPLRQSGASRLSGQSATGMARRSSGLWSVNMSKRKTATGLTKSINPLETNVSIPLPTSHYWWLHNQGYTPFIEDKDYLDHFGQLTRDRRFNKSRQGDDMGPKSGPDHHQINLSDLLAVKHRLWAQYLAPISAGENETPGEVICRYLLHEVDEDPNRVTAIMRSRARRLRNFKNNGPERTWPKGKRPSCDSAAREMSRTNEEDIWGIENTSKSKVEDGLARMYQETALTEASGFQPSTSATPGAYLESRRRDSGRMNPARRDSAEQTTRLKEEKRKGYLRNLKETIRAIWKPKEKIDSLSAMSGGNFGVKIQNPDSIRLKRMITMMHGQEFWQTLTTGIAMHAYIGSSPIGILKSSQYLVYLDSNTATLKIAKCQRSRAGSRKDSYANYDSTINSSSFTRPRINRSASGDNRFNTRGSSISRDLDTPLDRMRLSSNRSRGASDKPAALGRVRGPGSPSMEAMDFSLGSPGNTPFSKNREPNSPAFKALKALSPQGPGTPRPGPDSRGMRQVRSFDPRTQPRRRTSHLNKVPTHKQYRPGTSILFADSLGKLHFKGRDFPLELIYEVGIGERIGRSLLKEVGGMPMRQSMKNKLKHAIVFWISVSYDPLICILDSQTLVLQFLVIVLSLQSHFGVAAANVIDFGDGSEPLTNLLS